MLMILSSNLFAGETHQIEKLTECIVDLKNWMTSNFLLLNSEKTVLIIGPKNPTCNNLEHYLIIYIISIDHSIWLDH